MGPWLDFAVLLLVLWAGHFLWQSHKRWVAREKASGRMLTASFGQNYEYSYIKDGRAQLASKGVGYDGPTVHARDIEVWQLDPRDRNYQPRPEHL